MVFINHTRKSAQRKCKKEMSLDGYYELLLVQSMLDNVESDMYTLVWFAGASRLFNRCVLKPS